MNFILVNGRTPCRTFNCALCGKPIGNLYLREMSTHLYYCDHDCYVAHCKRVIDLAPLKRAALAAFGPRRANATAEPEVVLTT